MLRTITAAVLALASAPVIAQDASRPTDGANPLAAYRGEFRPLIVFSSPTDPKLLLQTNAFDAAKEGLVERDQVVLVVVGTGARTIEMRAGAVTQGAAPDNEALRERFGVAPDEFAVVLVGKDGGEKLRKNDLLTMRELFATIDAMPMRQREMREDAATDG